MRVFLLEYITGGGLSRMSLPPSLLREGMLMRDALLADFGAIANVEVITTYDARLALPAHATRIDSNTDAVLIWQEMLKTCDAALLVAPETGGVLAEITQRIEAAGVTNLGCTQGGVMLAGSKYNTFRQLEAAHILTIPTYTAEEFLQNKTKIGKSGYVVKPGDGAGCGDTFYFSEAAAAETWLKDNGAGYIVQPYQEGIAASLSMLCRAGRAWLLSCNRQKIELHPVKTGGSRFQYLGSWVNGLSVVSGLADSIAATFPDLNGYVGVDVILDGDKHYVVEINPRITTSYIGLRESLGCNPAELILDLAYKQTFELSTNMGAKMVEISVNE